MWRYSDGKAHVWWGFIYDPTNPGLDTAIRSIIGEKIAMKVNSFTGGTNPNVSFVAVARPVNVPMNARLVLMP